MKNPLPDGEIKMVSLMLKNSWLYGLMKMATQENSKNSLLKKF
jgi:hypothetical protein